MFGSRKYEGKKYWEKVEENKKIKNKKFESNKLFCMLLQIYLFIYFFIFKD